MIHLNHLLQRFAQVMVVPICVFICQVDPSVFARKGIHWQKTTKRVSMVSEIGLCKASYHINNKQIKNQDFIIELFSARFANTVNQLLFAATLFRDLPKINWFATTISSRSCFINPH